MGILYVVKYSKYNNVILMITVTFNINDELIPILKNSHKRVSK